jgi:hypothetical protein
MAYLKWLTHAGFQREVLIAKPDETIAKKQNNLLSLQGGTSGEIPRR